MICFPYQLGRKDPGFEGYPNPITGTGYFDFNGWVNYVLPYTYIGDAYPD